MMRPPSVRTSEATEGPPPAPAKREDGGPVVLAHMQNRTNNHAD